MSGDILSQLSYIDKNIEQASHEELEAIAKQLGLIQRRVGLLATQDYKKEILDKIDEIEIKDGQIVISFPTNYQEGSKYPWYVEYKNLNLDTCNHGIDAGKLNLVFNKDVDSDDIWCNIDPSDAPNTNLLSVPLNTLKGDRYETDLYGIDVSDEEVLLANFKTETDEERSYLYCYGEVIPNKDRFRPIKIKLIIREISE
ncbi:hypothetical protein MK079_04690 [Candidatus Gracilibacteria bacterium]|nr:hypothetical protein [Candidatus Gracilibacteria bacterium]